TQSYLSKIESGQRRFDVLQLKEFAKLYKKPLDYFVK
ncbi:MAG: helix-turn-helix transcriptional regulator, partial [Patescibacteria group bacterium]